MSLLDDSYINTEHVPTIGERNLTFQYKVRHHIDMEPKMYFEYQDMVVNLVKDIKAGHSLKVCYVEPLIKKYFPSHSYKAFIDTNYRTMRINISSLSLIFDSYNIASIEINCGRGNLITSY